MAPRAIRWISLAVLVPGRQEVLHVRGTGWVTNDPSLLSTLALKEKAPHLALCVRVLGAELVPNAALHAAALWQPSSHVTRADVPDLMGLATQHLARNRDTGVQAALLRALARALGVFPESFRRLIDKGLRSDLAKEGYEAARPGQLRRQKELRAGLPEWGATRKPGVHQERLLSDLSDRRPRQGKASCGLRGRPPLPA